MRQIRRLCLAVLLVPCAQGALADSPLETWQAARDTVFEAAEVRVEDFLWQARPVVVFAESPNNPDFADQMTLLQERIGELIERDVVIITDTTPTPLSPLRKALRPRGFSLVLIGKDGQVKLRKPFPWDVRELGRVIDKMPMRQRELRR